jgi:DNA modification methylase
MGSRGLREMSKYVFKLRSNIDLEGDVDLAEMELNSIFDGEVEAVGDITDLERDIPELGKLTGFEALQSHIRENGQQAFQTEAPTNKLSEAIEQLSFVQRIYVVDERLSIANLNVGPVVELSEIDGTDIVQAIPHYALLEISDVVARRSTGVESTKENLNKTLDTLLGRTDKACRLVNDALTMKNLSGLLSHDIHYYKAKFFPRMARSIINTYGSDPDRIIDNFVGSGTALLEASQLGAPSIGYDIDPLSVFISNTKLQALEYDSASLEDQVEHLRHTLLELSDSESTNQSKIGQFNSDSTQLQTHIPDMNEIEGIEFPDWLMANQKMTEKKAEEIGKKIRILQHVVSHADSQFTELFRVLMSDVISRKIKFRFLGTGVGRFSLTFTKTPMEKNFISAMEKYVKVAAISEWIQENLNIDYVSATALRADARELPCEENEFDFLITSPPYLPASSGRESYAKARAPSLIALGIFEPDQIADLAGDAIGSMDPKNIPLGDLTEQERDLVEWLLNDDLREIKGPPTAKYFLDMRKTFEEMRRILEPGAKAVMVSGKQSTFYESESRETLYTAEAAEMLADEAEIAGFELLELQDIQLEKPNKNARPRSLDDYYETLIVLQNPE